jgi:hypothetical protein
MWILAALLALLSLAMIYRDESGMPDPKWSRCKESLVKQIFKGECTLRFKGEQAPS